MPGPATCHAAGHLQQPSSLPLPFRTVGAASGSGHLADHLVIHLPGPVQLAPFRVHVCEDTVRVRQLGALGPRQQHSLAQLHDPQEVLLRLRVVLQLARSGADAAPGLALCLPRGVELCAGRGNPHQRPLKRGLGVDSLLLLEETLPLPQQRDDLIQVLVVLCARDVHLPVHLLPHLAVSLRQLGVELLHLQGALTRGPAAHCSPNQSHPLSHEDAIDEGFVVDAEPAEVHGEGGVEFLLQLLDFGLPSRVGRCRDP
mmetsp:Transcript_18462/g.51706  ORF Transcript_18462/g.51706 Transcript_18462/m.51706 type:complete len:257 (-) Transcript_18462:325-1095(-)